MSWTGTSSCIPAGRLERSSCAGWSEAPVALGTDGLDGYGCCMTRHASSSGNSAGSEHVLSRGAAGARRGRFLGRPATSHGTGGSGVGGSTGSCKVGSEADASDSSVCDARTTSASMLCGFTACTARFLLLGMLPKAAEPGCSGGASGGGGSGGNGSAGVAGFCTWRHAWHVHCGMVWAWYWES